MDVSGARLIGATDAYGNPTVNTGGGGGTPFNGSTSGGSGIVVIRYNPEQD